MRNSLAALGAALTLVTGSVSAEAKGKAKPHNPEYLYSPTSHAIFRVTDETRAAFYQDAESGACYWIPKDRVPKDATMKIDKKNLSQEMLKEPNCSRSIPDPRYFDD